MGSNPELPSKKEVAFDHLFSLFPRFRDSEIPGRQAYPHLENPQP